jgi:hypothetical protein
MTRRLLTGVVLLAFASPAPAQTAAPAAKSLAQQWGLSVFPSKGQTRETQDKDEYDCYQWAKQNTGIDPLAPAQAATTAPAQQPKGGAVKGGAKGAAVGAAIGAAAGDAGKGAAIGAAAGGAGGAGKQRRQKKAGEEQAQAEEKAAAEQTKATFGKGFAACMEGKGYTVK